MPNQGIMQGSMIIDPSIPLTGIHQFNVRFEDKNSEWITVGITKKTHVNQITQEKRFVSYGWGVDGAGYKYSNGNLQSYMRAVEQGEIISLILNREEGTLSVRIDGEDMGVMFENEEF